LVTSSSKTATPKPLADGLKEAERIVVVAEEHGLTLRLLGGLAIAIHCPNAQHRAIKRTYGDIDLAGFKKEGRQIRDFFEKQLGYKPNEMFNALRSASRLMFFDIPNTRRVDIFLDNFEMCHKIDLRDSLKNEKMTITLADLLATKLQIVQTNEKDFKDIIAILIDHELGNSDADAINVGRLAKLCGDDWGMYKTFTTVLDKTSTMLDSFDLDASTRDNVKQKIVKLKTIIEDQPKSMNWKMRARVGEKVPWYKLPEDQIEE
jgi:hypothetical protein